MPELHPMSELFPQMSKKELHDLADDIKQNGLIEDIKTYEGKVLDGRNRLLACEIAGVEPRFEPYHDSEPLAYVIGKNLNRRHLSESQRAIVAAKILALRDEDNWKNKRNEGSKVTKIASEFGVADRLVYQANKIVKNGDATLIEAVESGEISTNVAQKLVELPKNEQKKIVKNGPKAAVDAAKEIATKEGDKKSGKRGKKQADQNAEDPAHQPETTPAPPVGKLETYYRNDGIPDLPGVYRPRFMRATNGQEVVLDAYGTPAAPAIGDTFADTELRQLYYDLNALAENGESLLKQFEKLKASNKTHQVYTWVNIPEMRDLFEKFRNTAVELSDHVLGGIPYAICPDCHGSRKNCKSCRSSGYWPKSECDVYPDRFRKAGAA